MKSFSLKGKTCIVTGAGQGIGRYIAKELSKLGAKVTGLDKKYHFDKYNYDFICHLIDLEKPEDVESFCKQFKNLDVLINCAGITIQSEKDYSLKDWNKTVNINLTAPFLLIKNLRTALSKNEGSIINISSLNGKLSFPNNPAYVATKTGLDGLTRSYALDYGSLGIRVNSIAPGYIKTAMTGDSWLNLEKRNKRKNRTMLGRWGTTQDLIGPIIFLASDASSYITGQTIYVDGGWSSKGF